MAVYLRGKKILGINLQNALDAQIDSRILIIDEILMFGPPACHTKFKKRYL